MGFLKTFSMFFVSGCIPESLWSNKNTNIIILKASLKKLHYFLPFQLLLLLILLHSYFYCDYNFPCCYFYSCCWCYYFRNSCCYPYTQYQLCCCCYVVVSIAIFLILFLFVWSIFKTFFWKWVENINVDSLLLFL